MSSVMTGAKNGAGVLAGRVVSRAIPDLIGATNLTSSLSGTTAAIALGGLQLASGILLAYLLKGVGGADFSTMFVAGTFDGVYEDIGVAVLGNTGVPGKYLGGYSRPLNVAARRAVAGYSRTPSAGLPSAGRAAGRVGAAALRRIGVGAAARVAR